MTFLVSGVWHGANWTFLIWGCMHGVCQIVEKALGQQKNKYGFIGKSIKILITFFIVNFAWIFFRMPTLFDAWGVISHIFDITQPMNMELPQKYYLVGLLILLIKDFVDEYYPSVSLMNSRYLCVRWISYFVILVMIMLLGVFGVDQFIYVSF